MKKRTLLIVIVAVLLAFGFGMMLGGSGTRYEHAVASAPSRKAGASVWTCSMHPQIKQPEPGDCPLCGMDLIPLKAGVDDNGPRELTLSEGGRSLADIQVQPVRRQAVVREVRMVGTIDYDERRLSTITAWVGGRLDRIFVDYTGVTVAKGDHMVWMYSPEILGAQEELLQASIAVRKMADNPLALIRNNAQATLEASRDKLRLWGLSLEQIAAIEESGKASDHIQINAPIGGVVIHKNATEGMYVKTGTPIYQIVDLSQVWAQLDAYESDLAWLRYGQEVSFESEAYPGEVFNGRVSFIDPVLSRSTRTVKVRVNVPNEDGRLKPGMFVRAILHSAVAAGGKVIDADLAGKWISPMHPEIVRDEPGPCDICGMALVRSEDLGFVSAADFSTAVPLVVPASAPLLTGKRAVVYVQNPADPGRFTGRTVTLGPRVGGFYVLKSGLEEGELVVTHGNFKIDSALQIMAKPSMMSPAEEPAEAETEIRYEAPKAFLAQLQPLFTHYLAIQQALAGDNLAATRSGAGAFSEALQAIDMSLVTGAGHMAWMGLSAKFAKSAKEIASRADIDEARAQFEPLSTSMIALAQQFGTGMADPVSVAHCPMALDNSGANWLQLGAEIANPYFGASMLRCGEVTATIDGRQK